MIFLRLLLLVTANVASLLAASELVRRLNADKAPAAWLHVLVVRLALISTLVLGLGLARCLSAAVVGALAIVALFLLLGFGAHRRLPGLRVADVPRVWLLVCGVVAARLLLQVWFFSPHNADALSYHLPKVAEWVRTGAVLGELGLDSHASFPAGFELIEAWWVVPLHHDVLIEMAGVEFLVLGFAAVWTLSRCLGLERRPSFKAGLVYVLTPGLHFQATSCLNDAAVAVLIVATAAGILAKSPPGLLVLLAGMGVGTKPVYGYAVPALALLWVLDRNVPGDGSARSFRGWAPAIVGVFLGGFWYLRNAAIYGSPIYPVGPEGLYLDGSPVIQFGPSGDSLAENLLDFVNVRLSDRATPAGAHLDRIAGWGAVAFSLGWIGTVFPRNPDRRFWRLAGSYALALALVFLFVRHDDYSMRFVLFFPSLLAIAAARLAEAVRPARWVMAGALVVQMAATTFPYDLPLRDVRVLARQPWRTRSAAPFFDLGSDPGPVAYWGREHGVPYLLYGPDFERPVVYLRPRSSRDIPEQMKKGGAAVLYAPAEGRLEASWIQECLDAGTLQHEGGETYRLR
jgi:hypothetical protein